MLEPTKLHRLYNTYIDTGDYKVKFDYNGFMAIAKIEYKPNTIGVNREILFSYKNVDRVMEIADLLDWWVEDTDEEEAFLSELAQLIGF